MRRETTRRLEDIQREVDRIYTALVVRDPGTPLSADAYEGLRRQVVAAAGARITHLAQLAEFDVALRRGASANDLQLLVDQWLAQAGVQRVEDPSLRDAFEPIEYDGNACVAVAAYIDSVTSRIVRQGRLQPIPTEAPSNAESEDATRGNLQDSPKD